MQPYWIVPYIQLKGKIETSAKIAASKASKTLKSYTIFGCFYFIPTLKK